MRGALSAAGLGLIALAGCATNTVALEEELSRLRREVRTLHEKMSDSDLKLERLEGRVTLLALGQSGEVAPAPKTPVVGASDKPRKVAPRPTTPVEPKITQLAGPQRTLPVVKFSGTSDEEGGFEQGAIDDGSPPIMIKLGPEEESLPVDHAVLAKPDPVLDAPAARRSAPPEAPHRVTKSEVKAAYEIALAKLRIDGDVRSARKLFRRFNRRYPTSELADNATYWLAECDFKERRYADALKGFQRMIDTYPRSPKVPDALVRSAEARSALHQDERAEVLLSQVIAQYPDSEAAQKAKTLLQAGSGRR